MVTNAITPARNSTEGSPGVTNTNAAKDYFCPLDLILEVQNVSTVLGQFRIIHEDNIGDDGFKHLGVMIELLDLIYEEGRQHTCIDQHFAPKTTAQ